MNLTPQIITRKRGGGSMVWRLGLVWMVGLLAGAGVWAQTPYPAASEAWNRPGTLQGVSYEPESTADAAMRAALRDAQAALLPRVRDVARAKATAGAGGGRGAKSGAVVLPVAMPSDEVLGQVIAAALAGESLVLDKKLDQQQKSYGEVYYAAVLVDASPGALDGLAGKAMAAGRAVHTRTFAAAGSTAALLAVVVLVYVAANALTRGYYQWRLRLLAAGASVAGMAVVAGLYFGFAAG